MNHRPRVDGPLKRQRRGRRLGYGDQFDSRPPYRREFIYKDKQRDAVIEAINQAPR